MKYLKGYKIFLENDEFEIEVTDEPDVKMSKEGMNEIKSQIIEYKTKKPLIDTLYLKSLPSEELSKELEKIIGINETDRNPFLIEYANLSRMKSDITKSQKDNVDDKIKIDDFQQELNMAEDDESKLNINSKISDIKNRMSERSEKIKEIEIDLVDNEKKHVEKMLKIESDMKEYIENISSSNQIT